MNQRTKDVYVIPSVITLVGGLLLIPVTAYLTNVPMRTIITFAGIKDLWFAPVSAWVVFMSFLGAGLAVYLYRRTLVALHEEIGHVARLIRECDIAQDEIKQIQREHAAEMQALKKPGPSVEVVWDAEDCAWGLVASKTEPASYLRGAGHFSTRNTVVNHTFIQATVNGSEPMEIDPITIKLGTVTIALLLAFIAPPIGTAGEDLEADITLIDNRNRRFQLPPRRFKWVPPPPESPEAKRFTTAPPPINPLRT